jgi:hypothetical protein
MEKSIDQGIQLGILLPSGLEDWLISLFFIVDVQICFRLWGFAEGEKSMIFIYAIVVVVINWIEAGIGFQNLDHCAVEFTFDCWVENSPSLDVDGMLN